MDNDQILKFIVSPDHALLYPDFLRAMDAAREDEAGKWETKLKEERERAGKLLEAAELVSHLHACEQEGLSSGKPTPAQWFDATNKLAEEISNYKNNQ